MRLAWAPYELAVASAGPTFAGRQSSHWIGTRGSGVYEQYAPVRIVEHAVADRAQVPAVSLELLGQPGPSGHVVVGVRGRHAGYTDPLLQV
jgi:hypothetical protein